MALISFQKSHSYLDRINVPRLDFYENNIILKKVDFAIARNEGNIRFEEDGVYLMHNGKWIRGYYYMPSYLVNKYSSYPKFHLFECQTMRNRQMYTGTYHWANAPLVDVWEREDEHWIKDVKLELCNYCSRLLNDNISNTKDFAESNTKNNVLINNEVENIISESDYDIFGYPVNWKEIASNYKKKVGLICESCLVEPTNNYESYYFDVDHINSHNKKNCSNDNLQLLCKICHTYKDSYHLKQAITYPNRNIALHEFVRKYKLKLEELENPFLSRYCTDFKNFLE